MHIPPYFKTRVWKLFFLGVITGSIVAYTLFAFMYGKMYEDVLTSRISLQAEVTDLKRQNEALLQDKEDLSEKSQERVVVESMELMFINPMELKIDRLMIHQFEDVLRHEINHIIGKDINSLAESDQLLISAVENKTITLDETTYRFEIAKLIIGKKIKLTLIVKLAP